MQGSEEMCGRKGTDVRRLKEMSAMTDNSMRAGIEEDLDWGVLPSSESQNCAKSGRQ